MKIYTFVYDVISGCSGVLSMSTPSAKCAVTLSLQCFWRTTCGKLRTNYSLRKITGLIISRGIVVCSSELYYFNFIQEFLMNIAQPVSETIRVRGYISKRLFHTFCLMFPTGQNWYRKFGIFRSRGFSIWACNDLLHCLNIPKSVMFELVIRIVHDILGATNNTLFSSIPKNNVFPEA